MNITYVILLNLDLFNKRQSVQQILLFCSTNQDLFNKREFVQQKLFCSTNLCLFNRWHFVQQMDLSNRFVMLFCCNRIFVATNEHNKSRGRALVCHAFIPNEAPIPPVAGAVPSILAAESMFSIRFHSVFERLLEVQWFHKLDSTWAVVLPQQICYVILFEQIFCCNKST